MAKKKKQSKKEKLEGLMNFLKLHAKRMQDSPTPWETILYRHLKDLHYKFEFQVPIIVKEKHGYILDFLLYEHNIFIEADGRQFHSTKEQIKKDNARTRHLKSIGYIPLRFSNKQISTFTKETIHQIIQSRINQIVKS